MGSDRPIAMSVAGLDPCAGAGLLADIKTFEQHKVYGLGVPTSQTLQTHSAFFSIRWENNEAILEAIDKLLSTYLVAVVKIGIVQNIDSLRKIVSGIHSANKEIKIIFDPVIRSSTNFNFWQERVDRKLLNEVLSHVELITPNYNEVLQLIPSDDPKSAAKALAQHCNVLLKGGHNIIEPGIDYLFAPTGCIKLEPEETTIFPKHGSGCVLSSAIAANIAKGNDLVYACRKAKSFTEKFLRSNPTLLGYHVH